jgi:hypothetical protein
MIVEFPNSKSKSYFIETQAPNDGFLVLQWYNSGIFVKFGNKIVGFDHAINLINNLETATNIYMPGEQFALI